MGKNAVRSLFGHYFDFVFKKWSLFGHYLAHFWSLFGHYLRVNLVIIFKNLSGNTAFVTVTFVMVTFVTVTQSHL